MTAVYLTLKSANRKVGPIPVSTIARETCPDACPLKNKGCYAEGGPLSILWRMLSKRKPGASWRNAIGAKMQSLTWSQYCAAIKALPIGQAWRHAQAGDLPGKGDRINARMLWRLVKANVGKRGWTYTHKPVLDNAHNARAIMSANLNGFVINLSANGIHEVDKLMALDIAPVVTVLPHHIQGKQDLFTDKGTRVVVCPATYSDTTCVDCMLCARKRNVAVGFPAHGMRKNNASAIAVGV